MDGLPHSGMLEQVGAPILSFPLPITLTHLYAAPNAPRLAHGPSTDLAIR